MVDQLKGKATRGPFRIGSIAVAATAAVLATSSAYAGAQRLFQLHAGDTIVTQNRKVACADVKSAGVESISCGRVSNTEHAYSATIAPSGIIVYRNGRIVWAQLNP